MVVSARRPDESDERRGDAPHPCMHARGARLHVQPEVPRMLASKAGRKAVEQAENRHRDLGTRLRGLLGSGAVASQQDGGGHGLFYAGFAALAVALALAAGSLLQ